MTIYREYRFYSPTLDCEASRLSLVDGRGQEFFAIVAAGSGKGWRERREEVLDALDEAITSGVEPGEVRLGAVPVISGKPWRPEKAG